MGNYWSIHLRDLLADNGTMRPIPPRGLRLATYWTEIVAPGKQLRRTNHLTLPTPSTPATVRWVADDLFRC
jgi:hypothetical protein